MSVWVPFTAHVEVETVGTKRSERAMSLKKLATAAYSELSQDTTLNLTEPAGGHEMPNAGMAGFSGYSAGAAIVPKFGDKEATIRITGHSYYGVSASQVTTDTTRILSNGFYYGNTTHLVDANPTSAFTAAVKALKAKIQTALENAFPGGTDFTIVRLSYGNQNYGRRGMTFPA